MSPLLDAILGQQYKPIENPYGIGAAGVVSALPTLQNPYASSGKNALLGLGGTLLAGILAGQARNQADAQNKNLFSQALSMRSMTPEALQSAVNSEPRLSGYGAGLLEIQQQQDIENAKLERQNKLEIERLKEIEGVKQANKMQELAVTNPFAYKQAVKGGLIGAIQGARQPEASIPDVITNQVQGEATGQELANTLQELGGAKTSRFEDLMNEYGGNETIVNQILGDERDRQIKQREEIEKYLNDTQPSLDNTELTLSNLKNALIEAKDTGGMLGEDTARAAKLYTQSALGDKEASQRLAARKDLEALGLSAAAQIRKDFPGAVSNKEMELFLGAVPSTGNTFEQNKALYDRIEKGYNIAKQKQEFIQKSASDGLSLSEANKAFNNFNRAIPPFKDGDVNPLRSGLDFSTINTKDFLSGVPELKEDVKTELVSENISQTEPQVPTEQNIQDITNSIRNQQFGDPLMKGNALAQAVDSAMLGKSKYVLAPLDTAYEEAKDLVGLGEGRSIRENLSASVDRLGQGLKAGEEMYPKSSTTASLVGALASPVNKLYGGVKAVSTLGKLANVGKKAAITAGIAGVQAAGESDISSAAKTGALISGGLDALGGVVGKAAKIAPSVLNKAYGIVKSDYNTVAKKFSAKNLDKIKSSVDEGLNIIKKESGISNKEAFKSNQDFYIDMFGKSEESIAKRTQLVDNIINDISAVAPKKQLDAKQILNSVKELKPHEQEAVAKKVNGIVKSINEKYGGSLSLNQLNEVKRLYNQGYKYNPQNAEEVAEKGVADFLRKYISDISIPKLIKNKKIDKSYEGVITSLNTEIKDLINVQNIYAKKIPGTIADDVLSNIRQSLYTTGGAGTQGARNLGEATLGQVGGNVGTMLAIGTAANRVNRPVLQSFIKNQDAIRGGLESQGLRTTITSQQESNKANFEDTFQEPNTSKIDANELFNRKIGNTNLQLQTAQQQQSVSRPQSQTYNNSTPEITANQPVKEIKAFVQKLPPLIQAVIKTESNFNPNAQSKAGAKGLMQIMPEHYKRLGVTNPFDPMQSVKAGSTILQEELERYKNLPLGLAAYNAGSPAVERAIKKAGSRNFSEIAKYLPKETQSYVRKVINNMSKIRSA